LGRNWRRGRDPKTIKNPIEKKGTPRGFFGETPGENWPPLGRGESSLESLKRGSRRTLA